MSYFICRTAALEPTSLRTVVASKLPSILEYPSWTEFRSWSDRRTWQSGHADLVILVAYTQTME